MGTAAMEEEEVMVGEAAAEEGVTEDEKRFRSDRRRKLKL